MYELVVDNFAGGGGASTGIRNAIGRDVDIAINHDAAAIAMHRVNHPTARHYQEDVWQVDPVEACGGRPVGLAWFSPDCKHFSKAKGGKPVDKKIRGLAWVSVKWAKLVRPRVIMLENVEEFQTWGPIINGHPDPEKRGETFQQFVSVLRSMGYAVEWRELRAADYGTPTFRKRFFLIARCDGCPIVWPNPTHGDPECEEVKRGELQPWRTVKDIIDWSLPCPSIFASRQQILDEYNIRAVRPLSQKTLERIRLGVEKFGSEPFLIQYHDSREFRGQSVDEPIRTLDTSNRYGLCMAFLTQFNNNCIGSSIQNPLPTVTAQANHMGLCQAFLIKYYGQIENVSVHSPMPTQTAKDRFGLVVIKGSPYQIIDIGLRMLTPRELFDAQGFPHDYVIDIDADGNIISRSSQVARCGNAVCPQLAEALVRVNLPELCEPQRNIA